MQIIVGIDEVGRGPWAGPVVAAAVALPINARIHGVKDSKALSRQQRHRAAAKIRQRALGIGIGWSSHLELDGLGLTQAVRLCMLRAITQLQCEMHQIIIDGNYNYLETSHSSQAIIKADQSYLCVSAASIIAKVARDNYMAAMARLYPGYGFEQHVGYGTRLHQERLRVQGISFLHRRTFMPIINQLNLL